MVKYKYIQDPELDLLFMSLADQTRRDILARVGERSLSVNQIAREYDMSLPAVSKHLRILTQAGLVKRHKKGRQSFVSLNPQKIIQIEQTINFYRQFWNQQLDNLEQFLGKEVETDGI